MAVLSDCLRLRVSPARDFHQRLPLKRILLVNPQRMNLPRTQIECLLRVPISRMGVSVVFPRAIVKAKAAMFEDEPEHVPKENSGMPHLPCILNSVYLMGLRHMDCDQLVECVHQMEGIHQMECVCQMQCVHQTECLKLGECLDVKESLQIRESKQNEAMECLNPMRCVLRKECYRRLDCMLQKNTTEKERVSLKNLFKGVFVTLLTAMKPVTWAIIFAISAALTVPIGRLFLLASRGAMNFLRFWYKPAMFTSDWCGRKFLAYRGLLIRLGSKYAPYFPQPLVTCIDLFGLSPASVVVLIGWFLTLGSSVTLAVLVWTYTCQLVRSLLFWLANTMIRFYILLQRLYSWLPRLY